MNITTLPISYRPNRPFRVLFTPFIASCLFRVIGGENQIFPISTRSLRNKEQEEIEITPLIESYKRELGKLGIETESSLFFCDQDPEFTKFLVSEIQKRMDCGHYQHVKQKIHHCECGKVEVPSHVLSELSAGTRAKILHKGSNVWQCAICKSHFQEKEEVTVVYRLETHSDCEVLPVKLIPKFNAAEDELRKRPLLVSRMHRKYANDVRLGEFSIDPDHCWIHFLDYLNQTKGLNDFVVVVGLSHIPQAVLMKSFVRMINPRIRISFLITSLMSLEDKSKSVHEKTTLQELLDEFGSPEAVRTFLALQTQWGREKTALDANDKRIISQTFDVIERLSISELKTGTIHSFVEQFNRQSVVRILKNIRRGKNFEGVEATILQTLVGKHP